MKFLPLQSGNGNLASDAVSTALAYRAQAPVIDGLMQELGLSGGSLDGLVAKSNGAKEQPVEQSAKARQNYKGNAGPKPG